MALCTSKRPITEEECEDICQRQADGLDELLSAKLMGAECLEDLVCSEENFLRAEPDQETSTTRGGERKDCDPAGTSGRTTRSKGGSVAKVADATAREEDMFQGDLISCYLQEISHFPLLTPEREIELAKTIKKGQKELVALMWDERISDSRFDGQRQQ
ncbi:MAG: sigma-70 factor domain-containing protein, partial [Syntrophobacterales bacterium]